MNRTETPLKKAWKEARMVAVIILLVMVGFNLFASTGVPWIFEQPRLEEADDELLGIDDLLADTTENVAALQPMDTASEAIAELDTALSAAERMQEEKRRRDSLDAVKKEAQRLKDSTAKAQAAAAQSTEPAGEGDVKGISTARMKEIFDKKAAYIVDARRPDQFAEGHIPGAMNVYTYEFRERIPDILRNIPRDKLVVIYCDGGLCEMSHELAEQMQPLGYKRVVVYTGGMAEWTEKNYPIDKGGN